VKQAEEEEGGGGAPRCGAPFIAARGHGTKTARWQSHGRQSGGCGYGLDVIDAVWASKFGQ
jgi:hypothetical protein